MFEKEAEKYVPNINWHAYSSTKTIPEWLEIRKEEPEKWAKLSSELRASVEICEQLLAEGAVE